MHLPVTNPMIHSVSLLSTTVTVTSPFQNSARELTWPRIRRDLWPLHFLLFVGSLKDKVYKANPHTLEELRNNIRSEIATTSVELQTIKPTLSGVMLIAFGHEGYIFSICCSTGEFLLDFVFITANPFLPSFTGC